MPDIYTASTLVTCEKALKENYLPVWKNQLNIEPSPLMGKIKKIPLVSDKIVATAPIGLSGGFGFGAEGFNTPKSGHLQFERFVTNSKDMYVNICISEKATRLTGPKGSMSDELKTEVKAAYDAANWNIGRSLFGNGTGVLTKITTAEGKLIEVTDTKNLKEGLIVDVYAFGGTSSVKTTRIVSINRADNVIAVNDEVTGVDGGFITVQNSYKREITGIGAIFDDTITSLYGVNKEENPFLKPVIHDAGGDIDDGTITKVLRSAKNDKNSNVDMILCGDAAYDHYVEYLRTNNLRMEDMSHTIQGGFKAIKFLFGNKEVDIVNESFIPNTEMWGVDTSALELHTQEWKFADQQGNGSIFTLLESQSIYRALLANYGELICTNPGGCVRIHNCAAV